MNYLSLFLMVASAIVLACGQVPNYCGLPSCGPTPHITCRNNGSFATTCFQSRRLVNMNPYIPMILSYYNNKRNHIASGSVSPFAPAARMATTEWNPDLAELASLHVKRCELNSLLCHNTPYLRYSGENVAIFSYPGPEGTFSEPMLINNMMDTWWNERTFAIPPQIASYPSPPPVPSIAQFTAMVCERQKFVGCSASRWFNTITNNNEILFVCYLASTNIAGLEVYTAGSPASGCTSGTNPSYSSLCSTAETGYML